MEDNKYLFTYGTLAPGRENHDVIAKVPGVWLPATIKGNFYQHDWGAAHGCPGVVPDLNGS